MEGEVGDGGSGGGEVGRRWRKWRWEVVEVQVECEVETEANIASHLEILKGDHRSLQY